MKRISKIERLVLGSVLTVFLGCAALQQLVQKPVVTLQRTDVTDLSFSEGTLLFRFNVTNPNPIGVAVQKVSYRLDLNGKKVFQGVLNKGITIQASGTAPFELPITIRFLELYQSVQDLLKSERMAYDLGGALSIGPFDIPYKTGGTFPVPKLPEISLKNVKITRLALSGAGLLFTVHLKNSNPFSVSPAGLHYRIELAGTRLAEGDATQLQGMQENGESILELPLNVSFIELGRSAYSALTKSASQYRISGDIGLNIPGLGIQRIPFQKSGEVSLLK